MRALRIVLLTTGLVLLLAILAAGVFVVTFDPDDHRERIARLVKEHTGLTLSLNGPLDMTLYPWLGLTVEELALAGTGGRPLLSLDSGRFRIRLLPLVRGQYEIDTVQLDGAELDLRIDGQGHGNWQVLPGTEPLAGTMDSAAPQWPAALALGGLDVRNTRIRFQDDRTGQQLLLDDIRLRTGELLYGEPVDVALSARVQSNQPRVEGVTELDANVTYSDDRRRFRIDPLRAEGSLQAEGSSTNSGFRLSSPMAIDLDAGSVSLSDIEARGQDLALLLRIAGRSDLADRVDTLGEPEFDLSGSVHVTDNAQQITLQDFQAHLLGSELTGRLERDADEIAGAVRTQGPDLPLLLSLAGEFTGPDSLPARLGRETGTLRERGYSATGDFSMNSRTGSLSIMDLSAEGLGIRLNGLMTAEALRSDQPLMEGRVTLRGENTELLLRALDLPALAGRLRSFRVELPLDSTPDSVTIGPARLVARLAASGAGNAITEMQMRGSARYEPAADRLTVSALSLSAPELALNGELTLEGLGGSGAPAWQGRLRLADTDLTRLADALGLGLPQRRDPATLQRLGLEMTFHGDDDTIASDAFTIRLDQSTITGTASVGLDATPPRVQTDLRIDQLDVDRYLSPAQRETPGTPPAAVLPLAALGASESRATLQAEHLIVAGVRLQNLRAELTGSGQGLRLAPLEAALYNGTFRGEMDASPGDDGQLAIESDLALSGVNLAPLSRDLTGATQLDGVTDLDLSLATQGSTEDELRAGLDGNGSLTVREGVLYGVDVAATLAQLEAMLRARRLLAFDRGQQTSFDTLTADLLIRNGVVRSDDLLLLAPGFQVTGQGVLLDLPDNTIDYNLLASVDRTTARTSSEEFEIGGYSVPIACSGYAGSPSCAPDLESILRRAIGNEVQRRLGDFLQRLGE